jgi:hypothetical protein
MWVPIVAFVLMGLARVAGTSRQTWCDPDVAIALSLWGAAFVLHGVFIAGASMFSPVHELDVRADPEYGGGVYLYTNVWKTSYEGQQRIDSQLELVATLPDAFTDSDRDLYDSCIDYCLKHNKKVFPIHVQVSSWDSHIYLIKFNHVSPPVTIGAPPKLRRRPIIDLVIGLAFWWLAFAVWKEGRRRGIRLRVNDPFVLLAEMDKPT